MSKVISKKQQVVETAKHLFMKFGLKRVSIEEICKESNVSKMTFYKFFKNKSELALHIIKEITTANLQKYNDVMNSELSFKEKVQKTIDLKEEQSSEISQEFINDILNGKYEEVTKYLTEVRTRSIQMLLEDYKKAQEEGYIRKDINLQFIPFILNKLTEMSSDPVLASIYASPKDMVKELINFFFHGILTNEKK